MTVITYSSTAGSPLKEILVLEHPSASGNVPEPLLKSIEPQTMQVPSNNLSLEFCVVKGQKWIEQGDAKEEKVERKRETCGRGVSSMKSGRTEEQCNFKNRYYKKVRKDLKSSLGYMEGWGRSNRDDPGTDSARKQREKKNEENISEGEARRQKSTMKRIRWHHISIWLTLLLFSLGPNTASSQVRL